MEAQTATYFSVHGHSPGEAIFVPNPNGAAEDDGVLPSVVLDGCAEKSYLLVLDAKTMKEAVRADVDCVP
ncbi:carotenoid oxygenase [Pisolithus croceorrhizus]|nr:carotenoid oxygenase [Pisolithus croceorrhizus]